MPSTVLIYQVSGWVIFGPKWLRPKSTPRTQNYPDLRLKKMSKYVVSALPTVVILQRQSEFVIYSGVIVNRLTKMRLLNMFAPSLDHPVNYMCFYFAKTEIKLDFKCVFLLLY